MKTQQQAGTLSYNVSSRQMAAINPSKFRRADQKDNAGAKIIPQDKKAMQAKYGKKPDADGAPARELGVKMSSKYAQPPGAGQIG